MININEATDEIWEAMYQKGLRRGKFFSKTIHDGKTLKNAYMQARNQEDAIKKYFELCSDNSVKFTDDYRDYLFIDEDDDIINILPDIHVMYQMNTHYYVEVKNYHYTNARNIRLKFNVLTFATDTYQDIIDKIWKYDFHDADLVTFVTPDCKQFFTITKKDISLSMNDAEKPKLGERCKQQVTFYANRSAWIAL